MRLRASAVYMNQGLSPCLEDHCEIRQEKGLMVLADGFGGHGPGAKASKEACAHALAYMQENTGDLEATMPFILKSYYSLSGNILFNALIHANRGLFQMNREKGIHEKGGASIIAGLLHDGIFSIANVGAGQAWVIRRGEAKSLVTPRTYSRLCNPYQDGREDEQFEIPLMALGISEDLEPEMVEYRVESGDWILFHSGSMGTRWVEEVAALQELSAQGVNPEEQLQDALRFIKLKQFKYNASITLGII